MTTTMMQTLNVAWPRGVALELHPSPDYLSDHIRETGDFYEAAILDELARRITGGVLVDAGAMIGNHTAYLAAFVPHSAIHAFEPVPVNLKVLRNNAERSSVTSSRTVTVHPVALSDKCGRLWMTVEPGNLGHGVIHRWLGDFEVPAVTLDSLDLRDVSLIKVDVEGHEPQVLAGARQTIERDHPLIVIEDWRREYGALLPGYRLAAEWEQAHQTFLYEWAG